MPSKPPNRIGSSKVVPGVCLFGALFLHTLNLNAEEDKADIISACEEAARLLEQNDIDGALDEAEWCREGLLQIKQSQTLSVFPDEVSGFQGGDVTNESVLGMVTIGRVYKNGSQAIDLQLVSGGIAGMGSLGQLFNSLGALTGTEGEKLRIQRRTVVNTSGIDNASLTVSLKSGGMLMLESDTVSGAEAIEFLKAFPIEALDDALGE